MSIFATANVFMAIKTKEAIGLSATYKRRYRRFVFGLSKLALSQLSTKTNAEVAPRSVVYILRSVL